uniref:THAP domain-containing protein 1 n=1 Tax=Nothobranchius furzeri TaxID=105023 RepID=A0A8C6LG75_NOTFU
MLHCAAFGCNFQSEGNKGSDVSLHSFPTGKKRRKQWEDACGRTQLPKDPRLCSQHFSPDAFEAYTAGYKRRRKLNALPTIFPHKEPKRPRRGLDALLSRQTLLQLPLLSRSANHRTRHSSRVKPNILLSLVYSRLCYVCLLTLTTLVLLGFPGVFRSIGESPSVYIHITGVDGHPWCSLEIRHYLHQNIFMSKGFVRNH